MSSTISSRKPLRTYARQRKHPHSDEVPPTKRRRVDTTQRMFDARAEILFGPPLPSGKVTPLRPSSPSTTDPISSDAPLPSSPISPSQQVFSPPSSPTQNESSPPTRTRRPLFSALRKRKPTSNINRPLSERSHNVPTLDQLPAKKHRLVQMQLDLAREHRKTCKICGMQFIPSNDDDAAMHRKFHSLNVGGLDLTKAFIGKLKLNQVWTGGDGSFIAAIGRKDSIAFRNRALEVLKVVNTELGAVPIPSEVLWSPLNIRLSKDAQAGAWHIPGSQVASNDKQTRNTSDRYKVYLYIQGQKCIGACLAERIREAYTVLDQDDTSKDAGQAPADTNSSSISVGDMSEPAALGISRIWTSNLHRKRGIATKLLEAARSNFLYGITIPKPLIAFSQPTESGGRLARKWFGRKSQWLVYVD